jgi:hypothetical protein
MLPAERLAMVTVVSAAVMVYTAASVDGSTGKPPEVFTVIERPEI